MKILKAGTKITTVIGSIEAMVTGVCITMDTVEYRCRYFHNGEEKTMWLYRYELEVSKPKQKAGFGVVQEVDTFNEINLIEG